MSRRPSGSPGSRLVVAACVVAVLSFVWVIWLAVAWQEAVQSSAGRTVGLGTVVARFTVILGIPVAAMAFALLARRRGLAIAARTVATVVLVGWVLLMPSAGAGFGVAASLMLGATVLAIVDPAETTGPRTGDPQTSNGA